MLVSVQEKVATMAAPVVEPPELASPELDPALPVESAAPVLPEPPPVLVPAELDAPVEAPPSLDVDAPPPEDAAPVDPPELAAPVEPVLEPPEPPSSPQAKISNRSPRRCRQKARGPSHPWP